MRLNPPKPPVNHEPVEVGSFTRTATGESFVVTLPSGSTRPPAFPPSKITDLRAELSGEVITVKWTAPGASYDVGRGKAHIMKKTFTFFRHGREFVLKTLMTIILFLHGMRFDPFLLFSFVSQLHATI